MNRRPNFVVIFLDDSGWADFRPFGETAYPTPNVEKLAAGGCCYHQFYVPQAICSASRASLLTGCYPGRHKLYGAIPPRARGLESELCHDCRGAQAQWAMQRGCLASGILAITRIRAHRLGGLTSRRV